MEKRDIYQNFQEFQKALQDPRSYTWKKRTSLYHWYYLPEEKLFAPAKFIGYAGTNKNNFTKQLNDLNKKHGSQAIKNLASFFYEVDKDSSQFKELLCVLEEYCAHYSFTPNRKIANGKGAVYLPMEDFLIL